MNSPSSPGRSPLLSLLLRYCRLAPFHFGKGPLLARALQRAGRTELNVQTRHGSRFRLRFPEDRGWEHLYYLRTFETGTTDLCRRLLRSEDAVVMDLGANIGWYTVHFARWLSRGSCHSFEPMPVMFDRLRQNCELNEAGQRVRLNSDVVGEKSNDVEVYSFEGMHVGLSSISTHGRTDYTTAQARMITLDSYIAKNGVGKVDLIKMDVEGGELGVLKGSEKLLGCPTPPMWLIEMNVETAASFGHKPSDLLRFLEERGAYSFYRVVGGWGETRRMRSIEVFEHADNVLCVPACHRTRVDFLNESGRWRAP